MYVAVYSFVSTQIFSSCHYIKQEIMNILQYLGQDDLQVHGCTLSFQHNSSLVLTL